MSDKLLELEILLNQLPGAVERRRLGDRLRQAVDVLRDSEYRVNRTRAVLELAHLTEFQQSSPQGDVIDKLKEEAWEVGDALQNATTEDELKNAVYDYDRVLKPALASADKAVRIHWSRVVDERFRPIELLGELLERIGIAGDLGQQLRDCARRGMASTNNSQLTEIVANAKNLLAELSVLQKRRAEAIGSGNVGTFVNALAEGRATLELITPDVREWLEMNNALDRLGVTPR
ncbi:hypothetical protein [Bradyrhizobium cosmicum]|uniref:Uncharacterized protein n=1 Tax=Bradyrhizobium cosmicum TaxID=1404864 RepID=A0AAI8M8S9_9BRAD|nr:hypothetical protein [Bradyrhizobium cosmicum]BAL73770.1 hypothetical protein S23_05490 [Bradyrhizobium cosmicum]